MLESLSLKILVAECGFKAKLSFINLTGKGLVYLKAQVNGTNVSMLIDTGATNSFMTSECARKLNVVVEDTAPLVKVNFAQCSCQVRQVAGSVKFKVRTAKFEDDFTVCELEGVDIVL